MCILIACKKNDVVYMGTDTSEVYDDTKRNYLCQCNYKIQRLDNGILLSVIDDLFTRQTIIANSDIFTLDKKGKLTKQHIVKNIIPNNVITIK